MTDSRNAISVGLLGLLLVVSGATPSLAAEWHVDPSATNDVAFTSEVVTFSFEGHCDKVDGYLYWEGPGLFEGKPQLYFQIEVNAFDTGIGKRDRDLRLTLATEQHPLATYKAAIVSHTTRVDSSGQPLGGYDVVTRGTLSLHGIERKIEVPGVVVLMDSSATIDAAFQLRLEEYDIEAPSIAAFIKVSQQINVAVQMTLKRIK